MSTASTNLLVIGDKTGELAASLGSVRGARRYAIHPATTHDQTRAAICGDEIDAALICGPYDGRRPLDALRAAVRDGCTVPVIVVGDGDSERAEAEAIAAGAADYLPRSLVTPALLDRSIRFAVQSRREHRLTEDLQRRAAQLRSLASQLTQAEERERRRLAQLLHDHLQQLLVASRMSVGAMRGKTQDEAQLGMLARIDGLLDEAVQASRSLTAELSPPMLYESGLVPALQWLARRMAQQHGLEVDVEAEEGIEPVAEGLRVALFHAARELLFNVVKHAGTRRASLQVGRGDDGGIELMVIDTGSGFDAGRPANPDRASFGLFAVRERIQALGGEVTIDSTPGEGTCVTVAVPIGAAGEAGSAAAPDEHARNADDSAG